MQEKFVLVTKGDLRVLLNEEITSKFEELKTLIIKSIKPDKENLTVKEVSKILNVSELTVRNYIEKGSVKAVKIGRRILINRLDLENALSEVKSLKYKRS